MAKFQSSLNLHRSSRFALISLSTLTVLVLHIFPSGLATDAKLAVNSANGFPMKPADSSYLLAAAANNKRVAKQVGSSPGGTVSSSEDHEQAAGHHHGFGHHGHGHGLHGLGHGLHGDGKYFQYAHNPAYDEYEFGYRRGNDYHFQERYERGGPYWNFKTKVKWGDKYAGYGEHYWDYNHQDKSYGHGHGGDGGGGGGDGGHGHYSEPVPTYQSKPGDKKNSYLAKRQSDKDKKSGANEDAGVKGELSDETLRERKARLMNKKQRSVPVPEVSEESQWVEVVEPVRTSPPIGKTLGSPDVQVPTLSLDPVTGKVYDESTGQAYWLKPAN